jgi:hypothetical protein
MYANGDNALALTVALSLQKKEERKAARLDSSVSSLNALSMTRLASLLLTRFAAPRDLSDTEQSEPAASSPARSAAAVSTEFASPAAASAAAAGAVAPSAPAAGSAEAPPPPNAWKAKPTLERTQEDDMEDYFRELFP